MGPKMDPAGTNHLIDSAGGTGINFGDDARISTGDD